MEKAFDKDDKTLAIPISMITRESTVYLTRLSTIDS